MNTPSDKVFARVGAKVVITNDEGKILVLRRSAKMSRPGGWDFPGGASAFGEALEETVIRETREETGLIIKNPTLVLTHSYISEENEYIVLAGFRAHTAMTNVTLSFEHDLYEWLTPEEAKQKPWPAFHQKLVEKLVY